MAPSPSYGLTPRYSYGETGPQRKHCYSLCTFFCALSNTEAQNGSEVLPKRNVTVLPMRVAVGATEFYCGDYFWPETKCCLYKDNCVTILLN